MTNNELMEAVGEVLQAFEDGYFVRTTRYDHQSDFGMKLLKPLRSLAKLKNAYEEARTASTVNCLKCEKPIPSKQGTCPHCGYKEF